jgi:hypothetical protein
LPIASKRKIAPTTLASALATTAATGRSSPLPLPVSPTGPLPLINPHRSSSSSITGTQPLPPPPSFQEAMHLNVPFQPISATRSSSGGSGGNGSAPSSPAVRPNGMAGGMEHSHSDNEWEMVDLPPSYEVPVGGGIVAYEAPVGEHKGQPIAVGPISPGGPNGLIPGGPQPGPQVPPPFLSTVIAGRRDSGATTPSSSSLPLPLRPTTPSTPQAFATASPNHGNGPIVFQSPRSTSPLPTSRPASTSITATNGAPSTPASNRNGVAAVPSPISVALAVPTTPVRATTPSGTGTRTPRSPNSLPPLTVDQLIQVEAMGFKARTFQRVRQLCRFERTPLNCVFIYC